MKIKQSYYMNNTDDYGNIHRSDIDLVVNCCGTFADIDCFSNHNPRGRHDFYLQYITRGAMDLLIDNKHNEIETGQAIVHFPNTPYYYLAKGNELTQYYWVHFTGARAEQLVSDYKLRNQEIIEIGLDISVLHSFQTMFNEFRLRDRYFSYVTVMELIAILTQISMTRDYQKTDSERHKLSTSINFMKTHYFEEITIERLASLEHLSVSWYRKLFNNYIGCSPMTYLTNIRMKQAQEMLVTTDLTVTEISYHVGFKDPLYFTRVFKKHNGSSPTAYRSMNKQLIGIDIE